MFTEELLTAVEVLLQAKHPHGIAGRLNEVYILTTDGWICHPYIAKSDRESQRNVDQVRQTLAELNERQAIGGVVQVALGWVVEGKPSEEIADPESYPNKKEVLMLNGRGPAGTRVRVYELRQEGRYRKLRRLIGAFDSLDMHIGGV